MQSDPPQGPHVMITVKQIVPLSNNTTVQWWEQIFLVKHEEIGVENLHRFYSPLWLLQGPKKKKKKKDWSENSDMPEVCVMTQTCLKHCNDSNDEKKIWKKTADQSYCRWTRSINAWMLFMLHGSRLWFSWAKTFSCICRTPFTIALFYQVDRTTASSQYHLLVVICDHKHTAVVATNFPFMTDCSDSHG